MKLFKYIATAFVLGATTLSAHTIKDDINVIGGYMHGKFKNETTIFLPEGSPIAPPLPPGHVTVDTAKSKLDFGVVGLNGRFFVPELDCLCDYSFLHNIYVKGHAIWGWADKNRFTESAEGLDLTGQPLPKYFPSDAFLARGKTNGRSYDYNIGVGYLFDLSCIGLENFGFDLSGLAVGIEGGYAYRRIHLKTKHANDGIFFGFGSGGVFTLDDPAYHGTIYENKWDGGWVGGSLFYQGCAWDLTLSYEYNFAKHRGKNLTTQAGISEGFFSAKERSNHTTANIWTLEANYDVACGFTVGALFKYEMWNAKKGHWDIVNPPNGFLTIYGPVPSTRHINNSWNSYLIAGTIGYEF